jgi:hypothetical protein
VTADGALLQAIASGSEGAASCLASVRSAADMVAAGAAVPSSVERLVLLSALKHEDRAGDLAAAGASALGGAGTAAALASAVVGFGGTKKREEELFGGGLLGNMKRMMGGSEDMSAYMQHTPLLKQVLELTADGKLDSKKYPVGALVFPRYSLRGLQFRSCFACFPYPDDVCCVLVSGCSLCAQSSCRCC